MPARPQFVEGIDRAVALVEAAGGEALLLDAAPRGEAMGARLEALFTAEREAEWTEFLADCGKFEREIEREIRRRKFTPAELDEEEQSLERLRRWYRDIRSRDVFRAPSTAQGERRLKEVAEHLEEFAERVYQAGGST